MNPLDFPAHPSSESLDLEIETLFSDIDEIGVSGTRDLMESFRVEVAKWDEEFKGLAICFEGDFWTRLVSREPSDNSKWRVTLFDHLGPYSHSTKNTRLEALLEAATGDRGFPVLNPSRI